MDAPARRSRYSDEQRDTVARVYPFLRDTEDKEHFAERLGMTLAKLYNLASRLRVTRHYDDWFTRPDPDEDPEGYNPSRDDDRLQMREPFDASDAAWSPYEDAYLVKHFGKQFIEQISLVLDRPEPAIAYRARKLELREVASRSHEDLLKVCQRYGIQTREADEDRTTEHLEAELSLVGCPDAALRAFCVELAIPVTEERVRVIQLNGAPRKVAETVDRNRDVLVSELVQTMLTMSGARRARLDERIARVHGELRLRHAARYYDRVKVCAWLGLSEDELEMLLGRAGSCSIDCCDRLGQRQITLVSAQTLAAILSRESLGLQLIEKRGACGWFVREVIDSVLEVRARRRHWESNHWVSHGHTCLSPFAGLSFGLFYDGTDPHLIGAHLHPQQISPDSVQELIC